jgi:hypothetical protein
MKTTVTCLVLTSLIFVPSAQGGVVTNLLREGADYLSERLGRNAAREAEEAAARTVTREGAETALRRTATTAVEESAEQLARKAGVVASRRTGSAARAVARYGDSAAGLINHFGDDAAEALVRVSSRNGRRLVMLERELAESGEAQPILKLVHTQGDAVVDWIWANKATVAAGVGATVLLTNPDAVLKAGANVTSTAIDAVGTNVVRPFAEGIVWLISRLVMLLAVTAAGTYALWLKVPELRGAVTTLLDKGAALVRSHRK